MNQPSTPTPAEKFLPAELECPDCHGLGFFRADLPVGHPKFGKPIACDNPFHTASRLGRIAQASNLHAGDLARRLADITPIVKRRMVEKDGENIEVITGNKAMLDAAAAMVAKPYGWLYIWGGPGNAKSEVLISVVNEINESGRGPAMYCTYSHLVNWVRDAFKDGAEDGYIQRFERLKGIKLLAVDEMDKARDTDFSNEFRFQFLDEKYRQAILGESQMIFASNTNPNTLPGPLWDRIRDGRFVIVENTAPSARPNMKVSIPPAG